MALLRLVLVVLVVVSSWAGARAEPSVPTVGAPLVAMQLAEAIRFETVSHQDPSELDVAAFDAFRAFLRFTYPRVFSSLDVELISEHSLLIRWPGEKDDLSPVLFDAHYDVVPIEPGTGEDWEHPPFAGVIADGYVWGRGALDDKSAVISTLLAMEQLLEDGFVPDRTVYFSFGHDEEVEGRMGAARIAQLLKERGVRFDYVVGEGGGVVEAYPLLPDRTVALIAVAEKSYLTLHLGTVGEGGHSAFPPDDSALVRMSRAVAALHDNPFDAELVSPVDDMFRAIGQQKSGIVGFLLRNPRLSAPLLVSQLDDDRVGRTMIRTTTAVTIVNSGIKENVVPQRAEATVNFRLLPGDSVDQVVARVEEIVDDPRMEIRVDSWGEGPGVADIEGDGYLRIRAAVETALPDVVVAPALLTATTDSRHYSELTDDVYRFHPWPLDMSDRIGVHGTNERVSVEGMVRAVAISRALITQAAATKVAREGQDS